MDERPVIYIKQEYPTYDENPKINSPNPNTRHLTEEVMLKSEIVEDKQTARNLKTFNSMPDTKSLKEKELNTVKSINCETCSKSFANNVELALHSIIHSDDQSYSCHFCQKKIKSKYRLKAHIKIHDGTAKFKCKICNRCFNIISALQQHKNLHTGKKPFKCEICGKAFPLLNCLTTHRRQMHYEIVTGTPLVKYDCTICNKHYRCAKAFKRHNLSKHNEAGDALYVICDICGKKLASKEGLHIHKRIHTGQKPYSCQYCNKSFICSSRMEQHKRIHTGEKPYKCDYCDKCFSQNNAKKAHERTHTGERPFACELCNRGFTTRGSLNAHVKTCIKTTNE